MSKNMGPEALRILIVDDSEISRRITGTILRSRHWTVCGEAENGKDGVEKFQELKPDIVLLDLSMPDMTGIEAAQQMSVADHTIPLILFTVLEVGGIGVAAHQAGIQAIIPKSEAWSLIGSIEHLTGRQI
jgi:two-component system chemotaxis response regulator CheY